MPVRVFTLLLNLLTSQHCIYKMQLCAHHPKLMCGLISRPPTVQPLPCLPRFSMTFLTSSSFDVLMVGGVRWPRISSRNVIKSEVGIDGIARFGQQPCNIVQVSHLGVSEGADEEFGSDDGFHHLSASPHEVEPLQWPLPILLHSPLPNIPETF